MPKRIYLDFNATSPVRPEVRERVTPLLFGATETGVYGNASSVHWAGQLARKHLEAARAWVASRADRKASEVLFPSGGTEADNLALFGTMLHPKTSPRRMVLSAVEHPAVLAAAEHLKTQGVDVELVPVDSEGNLDLDALERALQIRTFLVCTMAVNNETGVMFDLPAIEQRVRAAGAHWMVDAVQAVGRIPVPTAPDLVVLSGHKIGGIKGAGCLLRRMGLQLQPCVLGGPQERGLRAGTEDVPAAVGLCTAWEVAERTRISEKDRLAKFQRSLEDALQDLPGVRIVGRSAPRVAGVTTALFEGVDAEVVLQGLDLEGIAVSSGSACSSGSLEPSHVLRAMGVGPEAALSAVRFSFGWSSTSEDVDRVLDTLPGVAM